MVGPKLRVNLEVVYSVLNSFVRNACDLVGRLTSLWLKLLAEMRVP